MERAAPSPAIAAPLTAGAIRLAVRDLRRLRDFYQAALGLEIIDSGKSHASLGAAGRPFVHLETRPGLVAAGPRAAGLFHAAFLLPDRASLGAWLVHAVQSGVSLAGASDHIVSEAIYLADPEGNGIEVYADRPPAGWRGLDGAIRMSTGPLDLNGLAEAANGPWQGFPAAGTLGHVHLQVGSLREADRFWQGVIGMELTTRYPGASFYAMGGYHHHIAANVWNSRNAPRRLENLTGLQSVRLVARGEDAFVETLHRAKEAGVKPEMQDGLAKFRDPWNIAVEIETEAPDAG